jgi:thiamine biosynthesis lipoprotein
LVPITGKDRQPGPVSPDTIYASPEGMCTQRFRAMGTTVTLIVPVAQSEQGMAIVQALFQYWESTLSRFLPASELAYVNSHAGETIAVSELFFTVLSHALDASRQTSGIYDPTMLRQLVQLGYDRSFDSMAARVDDASVDGPDDKQLPWQSVGLDAERRLVSLPIGVALDFGGIAKGMAVDAALNALREAGIENALVNAGGDLALSGLPVGQQEWVVAVSGKDEQWNIPLRRGAMATSGIARRHWMQGEHVRHHLLDPRTALPAENDLWSVTVMAGSCEQAEIAAKVAFVLGSEEGKETIREQRLAGLLVFQDGGWEPVYPWPMQFMG